jgi:hypothetical protein
MGRRVMNLIFLFTASGLLAQRPDSLSAGDDSVNIAIERLAINSSANDFSPYLHQGKLFFVSDRINSFGVQYADVNNQTRISDVYFSESSRNQKFRQPKNAEWLNTKYHEGPVAISGGGDTVYFTSNDPRTTTNKIYYTVRKNGKWEKPAMASFCTDSFSYCHPALAPGDSVIVFASNNRPANKMDLYCSRKRAGGWSRPVSLAKLNGPFNEVFPFFNKAGVLYFASDRSGGAGGLDLYKTASDADTVQHLSVPFNSDKDDFGIWTDSSGLDGYFSSNRNTNTGDDIYAFRRKYPDFDRAADPPSKNTFCYSFFEENTIESNDTLNLAYEWSFGDGTTARGLRAKHCFKKAGKYQIQLDIVDRRTGAHADSITAYELTVNPAPLPGFVCNDTAATGEPQLFDASKLAIRGHEIKNIYWSFGDGKFNQGTSVKHIFTRPGEYPVEMWVLANDTKTGEEKKYRIKKSVPVILKPKQ